MLSTVLALIPKWLDPQHLLETYGNWAVVAVIFAECGLFIGFFLPGDSLLFLAGFFSASSKFGIWPWWVLLPSLFVAAFVGDQCGYMLGTRMLMFFQEPQTVAKLPPGSALPLKYLFAASVFDSATRKMERLFTLETGFTSEVFLCAFERNGSHTNIGDGALLNNLRTFESAVLALVSKEWGVPVDQARPIPL